MFDTFKAGAALYTYKAVYDWYLVAGLIAGFAAMHAFDQHKKENDVAATVWGSVTLLGCAVPLCWFIFNAAFASQIGRLMSDYYLYWWAAMVVVGAVASLLFQRKWTQHFDVFKSRFTLRTKLERNKKTDVRTIDKVLPDPIKFKPSKYFDAAQGLFLGLGENSNPLYWPAGRPWVHMAVIGSNGSGKGVQIQCLISQAASQRHAVFVMDPKNDEWMPHCLKAAADAAGIPFHFVDLRPAAPSQINLFRGADRHQLDELMQAGFGLAEKGTDADFYRLKDRQACAWLSARIGPLDTPASLFTEHGAHLEKVAEGFAGYLKEMADIAAVNANEGLDLAKIVEEGGIVYVAGSMRNEKIKRLQRMVVVRAIQLAETRDRLSGTLRPVGIVMDEFIYHISKAALEALGAARDKGVYCVLAFQGIGDLARVPADLSADAVKGAIVENCKIKFVYRLEDPDTALWFAAMTGSIQADDESRKVEKNLVLVETLEGDRTIRQTDRFLIDENMLTNLHEGLGVAIGLKGFVKDCHKGEFISISRMDVAKDRAAITPQEWPGYQFKAFDPKDLPALPTAQSSDAVFELPALPDVKKKI